MRSSRFTDEQIISMIKEQESGITTAEVCRKYGISPASFNKYKSKFGGMDVSDARKLKPLESENAKLKKLLAEHDLLPSLGPPGWKVFQVLGAQRLRRYHKL